ncbi:MAG: hypothetical protein KDA24_25365 [Deltaproteobacteria bacterium]|nr:hypothetical protein [Deltaproteobacteria bacterium]
MLEIIVPCARGLEALVREEIEALGGERCSAQPGAVRGAGTWETVWRANLFLRCGRRVLVGLADWPAWNGASLGDGLVDLLRSDPGLRQILSPDRSVSVHGSASASRLEDGRAIADIVGEALRGEQRRRAGRESAPSSDAADLPLRVRVHGDHATLLLDTSGRPLDARGTAAEGPGHPRATVCAALFAAASWDGTGALCDPFAGDGRVLEEALAACEGWAPGRRRRRWPFEALSSWDPDAFAGLGAPAPHAPGVSLYGGDPDQRSVRALRGWGDALGVGRRLRSRHTQLTHLGAPEDRGLVVTAPPAGGTSEDWSALGEVLKHRFVGWTAAVLCVDGGERHLGLRPRRSLKVRDGDLEGTIVVLDLWAGRLHGRRRQR